MTDLHYSIAGKGTPIVLAHGFALDSRMWDDQVPELAARFSVVRYDLRGFGKSGMRDEPYSHAEDLKALIDRLALGRVALMGLSLGGGAAINFTIAYPDAVRALIVVDPSLGGFPWSTEQNRSSRTFRRRRGNEASTLRASNGLRIRCSLRRWRIRTAPGGCAAWCPTIRAGIG